jgi:protein-S-isoprenylcysteine O-methyltransferase Ste14
MTQAKRASKKPTWRKLVVYAAALLVAAAADPRPITFAIGCGLVAVALLLRIWAFGHLEKNVVMVTTGPYAYTRNPAYFGSFLALVGVALAAGNPQSTRGLAVWGLSVLLVIGFFAFYFPRKMKREYPRLQALFGEQVDRHAANVPDFWPQLTPWRSGDDRRFSWTRLADNHELAWGLVFALALAAIWFVERWSPLADWLE